MRHKYCILFIVVMIVASIFHPVAYTSSGSTHTLTNGQIFDMAAEGVREGDTIIVESHAMVQIHGDASTTYRNVYIICHEGSSIELHHVNIANDTGDSPLRLELTALETYTMELYGNNRLTHTTASGVVALSDLTIQGTGSLYVESWEAAIYASNNITIESPAQVYAIGPSEGITCEGNIILKGRLYCSSGPMKYDLRCSRLIMHDDSYLICAYGRTLGRIDSYVATFHCFIEDGEYVPENTKIYMYAGNQFVMEAYVNLVLGLSIHIGSPMEELIHYTKDDSKKRTQASHILESGNRVFESAPCPSSHPIDLHGTVMNGGTPEEGMELTLRSEPRYATTDTAGEFCFRDVNLYDHNLFISDHIFVLHFIMGDTFSWTQADDTITITLTDDIQSIDITCDTSGAEPIILDITAFTPSDNPDTGDR